MVVIAEPAFVQRAWQRRLQDGAAVVAGSLHGLIWCGCTFVHVDSVQETAYSVNSRFLSEPTPYPLATVLIHEARHQYDYVAHSALDSLINGPSGFCFDTESNALTEMTNFWTWAYNGPGPATDFGRLMQWQQGLPRNDAGKIDSRTWPAYQQECAAYG